jgi:kumamolisin
MDIPRKALAGSSRLPLAVTGPGPQFDPMARIEATVVLRRRAEPPADAFTGAALSREALAARYGAEPADMTLLQQTFAAAGVEVLDVDAASRRVRIAGTAQTLAQLFGTVLDTAELDGAVVRHRSGELSLPGELDGLVVAVLGLDDRPQARSRLRVVQPHLVSASYTPPQLARIYQMPTGVDGAGRVIAIIELGGGYKSQDLDTYFAGLDLSTPLVTSVSVDGASNGGGTDPGGADGEVLLDIEVAGGIAPGAAQVVYFAPNTDAGFLNAISTAAHASPTPTVLSISWGGSEDSWTGQARTAMDQALADAALLGVTVTIAAGDNGSADSTSTGSGAHVDFPASSPHALACGGTSLQADTGTGMVRSETVWNDGTGGGATGGGVSDAFALPTWQASVGVPDRVGTNTPGRGVPDVSAVADPRTGYQVLVDGKAAVYGGTSAVAPLWAGLICRLAQAAGSRFGLLQPRLYATATPGAAVSGFRDIATGNNGAYTASPGWDACTGLGVPDGTVLLAQLSGSGLSGSGLT